MLFVVVFFGHIPRAVKTPLKLSPSASNFNSPFDSEDTMARFIPGIPYNTQIQIFKRLLRVIERVLHILQFLSILLYAISIKC